MLVGDYHAPGEGNIIADAAVVQRRALTLGEFLVKCVIILVFVGGFAVLFVLGILVIIAMTSRSE